MYKKQTLSNAISRREFEILSADVAKKIEMLEVCNVYIAELRDQNKGSYGSNDKLRRDLNVSNSENSKLKRSLATTKANVKELLSQLNTANDEVSLLTERVKNEELRNEEYRKKLVDENNHLKELLDDKHISINHLESDLESLKQQFDLVSLEKNIAKISAKQHTMDDREKRMTKKIASLNIEIGHLTANLIKSTADLATARQADSSTSVQLEIELNQKSDEWNIANFNNRQFNQMLTSQRDKETMQPKSQSDELVTLVEHCKLDLDAKVKFERTEAEKKVEDLANQLLSRHEEIEQLRQEIESIKNQGDNP